MLEIKLGSMESMSTRWSRCMTSAPFSQIKSISSAYASKSRRREAYCRPLATQKSTPFSFSLAMTSGSSAGRRLALSSRVPSISQAMSFIISCSFLMARAALIVRGRAARVSRRP